MSLQEDRVLVENVVLQQIKLKKHTLDLFVSPCNLFIPNAVSRLFSKVVRIDEDDTVFDIGTGTGVLGIWAALEDSEIVFAVDPVEEHCELAMQNAQSNGVGEKFVVRCGSLFEPLADNLRADVIIGDVSGIADGPGKALGWYSDSVPTGGGDGTEVVVEMIDKSRQRLAKGGRLYFPVAVGLSNDERVMEVARACYGNLKQVVDVWFPLSEEEYDIVSCCLPQSMLDKVRRKGSRMAWNGHIFEATQPIM
ncbi:MAG: 50S ribosomal protein L11 methyltransferase [Pirellulales bacterium]|nr:50S ribosomal protein L11 methyltransferase [Pirellulales bacterium]